MSKIKVTMEFEKLKDLGEFYSVVAMAMAKSDAERKDYAIKYSIDHICTKIVQDDYDKACRLWDRMNTMKVENME